MQGIFGIHRGHRGGFSTTVTFVDFLTKLKAESSSKFRAQGFGTGNNHTHILKHQRVHVTAHRKGAQEGRRCHHASHMEFGAHASHGLHIGRVSHSHNRATFGQVQERRDRQAKAMEQRKFRKHHIAAAHIQNTGELLDVTHQVAVRKEHTLRRTFGTGTEHDHSRVVNACTLAEQEGYQPSREQNAKHQQGGNLCLRDFLHQVFGIKNANLV